MEFSIGNSVNGQVMRFLTPNSIEMKPVKDVIDMVINDVLPRGTTMLTADEAFVYHRINSALAIDWVFRSGIQEPRIGDNHPRISARSLSMNASVDVETLLKR